MSLRLYHTPKCGTSRAVLEILRASGIEPEIVAYLKTPPTVADLTALAKKLGGAADLLRRKEPLVATLGLDDADDAKIIAAIAQHPILLNRPIVETPKAAKVCRPAELVRTLL